MVPIKVNIVITRQHCYPIVGTSIEELFQGIKDAAMRGVDGFDLSNRLGFGKTQWDVIIGPRLKVGTRPRLGLHEIKEVAFITSSIGTFLLDNKSTKLSKWLCNSASQSSSEPDAMCRSLITTTECMAKYGIT